MPAKPKKHAKDKAESNAKRSKALKGKPRVMTPAVIANPGGRPSEFESAAPKIIQYIRTGNTYECASACSRISYDTFNRWMKQGKEDESLGLLDSQFYKFYKDVEQAEMEAELECVQAWRNFVPMNWQAARDFLARRNPDKWSSKDKVDVTSKGEKLEGQPVFLPMKKQDEQEA